jgi:TetR/AcrR family transcriptional regulator
MPETHSSSDPVDGTAPAPARKRPKPGERRIQILQTLAAMLEQPAGERITTAALAAKLDVSEAALYRHFASKAQMFEGLIDFIEESVFSLLNQIVAREQVASPGAADLGTRQAARIVAMVIQFAEKNPGMARVMAGDALVLEHERLQLRINQLFDKLEASLKQCLRDASAIPGVATPSLDAQVRCAVLVAFLVGRLHRFVRSGFRRLPSEHLDASLRLLLG